MYSRAQNISKKILGKKKKEGESSPQKQLPWVPEKKVRNTISCGSQIISWLLLSNSNQIVPTSIVEGHIHKYLDIIFCDAKVRASLCIFYSSFPGSFEGGIRVK